MRALKFSYNYTRWPFVEIGEEHEQSEIAKIDAELRDRIEGWALFMQENFDFKTGFESAEVRIQAREEYDELCMLLTDAGVDFQRDYWWDKP